MESRYFNRTLAEGLIKQKEAHDSLISALLNQITDLEKDLEGIADERFIYCQFLKRKHKELIPEFAAFAYKEFPSDAKKIVAFFHDETLDLSTLDCTGADFEPWEA